MKYSKLFFALSITFCIVALLTGCGDNDKQQIDLTTSTLNGVASKGPIKSGSVEVYALEADGEKGALLGTTTTGADGSYTVDLGSYTGDVVVEVSGGTYTDEATGATDTPNTLLRAALSGVSGTVSIAVTPLTEIAVQFAEDPNTETSIDAANSLVSSMVGVNIIDTSPVDVTSDTESAGATSDQLSYGLMLATMSQMMADGNAPDIPALITNMANDLIDDQKLDDTGQGLSAALNNFFANENNQSGVDAPDQTPLDGAINYITENSIKLIDENISDLNNAKALINEFRNTILSIYNYQGVGMSGIVETPFANLYNELTTKIEPELISTVDRIGWIIESVNTMENETNQTFTSNNYELEITLDPNTYQASFSIYDTDTETEIDSGTIAIDDPNLPVLGSIDAVMKTKNGEMTAELNYLAAFSDNVLTGISLTGSLVDPNYFSIDFIEGGKGLYVDITQHPAATEEENGELEQMLKTSYPTKIYLAGNITTTTARMEGEFDLPSIVWAENSACGDNEGQPRPTTATFEGSFEELKNNVLTGVKFIGTITGTWSNAATYDECDPNTANIPQWQASFDGKIEAPIRPTITTFLRVTQNEYRKAALEFNYRRTTPTNEIVSLSGTGTFDETSGDRIISATLTNQNGLKVSFSIDESKSDDEKFSGDIKTAGNIKMADIYTIEDVPMVKYIDDYLESII